MLLESVQEHSKLTETEDRPMGQCQKADSIGRHESFRLKALFVRSPSIQWGRHRATIVIVTNTDETTLSPCEQMSDIDGKRNIPSGLFQWEMDGLSKTATDDDSQKNGNERRSTKDNNDFWSELRAAKLPHLVPDTQAQCTASSRRGSTISVLLPNGKRKLFCSGRNA